MVSKLAIATGSISGVEIVSHVPAESLGQSGEVVKIIIQIVIGIFTILGMRKKRKETLTVN